MSARWLARATFVLMFAAAAVMIGFADLASLAMVAVGAVGACLTLAGGYWFLAHRGVVRWLAFGVVILAPIAVLVVFALHRILWVGIVAVGLVALAIITARLALTWPGSPPSTTCRSWSSAPAPATTSRWTWGWTATTRRPALTPSLRTGWNSGSTWASSASARS
jgi:hypothetical protein